MVFDRNLSSPSVKHGFLNPDQMFDLIDLIDWVSQEG